MGEGEGEGEGSCDDNHLLLMSEDVLIQILLLLPVISLLRFKSVCKSWRTIIESPLFINLHLATITLWPSSSSSSSSSSSKLGGSSLLFDRQRGDAYDLSDFYLEKKGKFVTLSGEKFEVFEDLGTPSIDIDEIHVQFLKGYGSPKSDVKFWVVGSLNGIICLQDETSRNVALWNPAIKQTRVLPKPSNLLGNPNCICVYDDGYYSDDLVMFGMDVKTMDYKLLLITTIKPANTDYGSDWGRSDNDDDDDDNDDDDNDDDDVMESPLLRRIHIYTLSTDSWRSIDTTTIPNSETILQNVTLYAANPNISLVPHHGIYLNGTYIFNAYCYIEGQEESCQMFLILSFDFTEEIFTNIEPPYDWRNRRHDDKDPYFIPFGEKLALVDAKYDEYNGGYEYTIWVLNDQHGVKTGFWTKFYTIGPIADTLAYHFDTLAYHFEIKCIRNDGEFAIICEAKGLKLFDLITQETIDIQLHCPRTSTRFHIYRPSLVPIVGGNGAAHNS